jgi:hypothetical protein
MDDRPIDHQRPSRQARDEGALHPHARVGEPLPGRRRRHARKDRGAEGIERQGLVLATTSRGPRRESARLVRGGIPSSCLANELQSGRPTTFGANRRALNNLTSSIIINFLYIFGAGDALSLPLVAVNSVASPCEVGPAWRGTSIAPISGSLQPAVAHLLSTSSLRPAICRRRSFNASVLFVQRSSSLFATPRIRDSRSTSVTA